MRALRATFLVAFFASACAMIRGGTPATDPGSGYGKCGPTGTVCLDTKPASCCPAHGACKTDSDGPFCEFNIPGDPSDPTMLARKPTRGARSPLP